MVAKAQDAAARANPTPAHEARVAMLKTLAMLTGHKQPVPLPLPDGTWPDILMADMARGSLFIGDGKASEAPHDLASRARIDGYVRWLVPHVRMGRPGVFAVCCPNLREARGWAAFLGSLMQFEHGLRTESWVSRVAVEAAVASILL